jgi:hypothetical protein
MESIQKDINENTPIDYAKGLCGIGAGLEYLAQHGFIEPDTDELLREVDSKIFRSVVYVEHLDVSLCTGISGIGRYLLFRLLNPTGNNENIRTLTNKMLIIHLIDILERLFANGNETNGDVYNLLHEINQLNIYPAKVNKLIKKYESQSKIYSSNRNKISVIEYILDAQDQETEKINLGLCDGYAGIGMYLLEKKDSRHQTWRTLL